MTSIIHHGTIGGLVMLTLLAASVLLGCVGRPAAAPVTTDDETDREILAAFLDHVESSARYCTLEEMQKFTSQPEDITWEGSLYIRMPLVAYQLTEDPKYLDMFVARMDTLCQCLTTGPDGYKGWYGVALELFRHQDHPARAVDVMITSFTMTDLIADFARTVSASDELKAKHGAKAAEYLALAEEHLVPKWEARGCYKDLGEMGAVYITHPDLKPTKANLTQPNNKHTKIIHALLNLYAATGKDEYAIKALKLGTRLKRTLTLADDRYQWNYWNPAGAWDVDPADPAKWKHWIGAEHRAGYYALSVEQAVVLYEHGLVLDRTDIDRFVRTQLEVCWNGDTENPAWFRTDGKPADAGHTYLSSDLAPFSERIRELAFGPRVQQARLAGKDHPWQGGPVAMGYLEAKYISYPKWRTGEPAEADTMQPFLAKPENRALVEDLAFTVEPPGYQPPMTPAHMNPMPGR